MKIINKDRHKKADSGISKANFSKLADPHLDTKNTRQKPRAEKVSSLINKGGTFQSSPDEDPMSSMANLAGLVLLAAKFPHRQFNASELSTLSGVGRTAMSQIKNTEDSPFSLGKCTLQRLDRWLAAHPGFKQS